MSGGHYGYKQYQLQDIADQMRRDIAKSGTTNEYGEIYELKPSTIQALKTTAEILEVVGNLVHDLDWCLSGDTNEDGLQAKMEKNLCRLAALIEPA